VIVCLECGHHNDEQSEFCASCGVFLEWEGQQERERTAPRPDHDTGEIGEEPPAASCPRCGEPNLAGLNWCSRCGLPLTGPPGQAPPSRPRRTQRVAVVRPWWRSTGFVLGALVAILAGIGVVVFSMGSGEPEAQQPIVTDAATTTATSEPAVAASPAPSAPPPPVESQLTASGVTASTVLDPDDGVTYDPELTLDGNPVTAWNDGVDGDPVGQWLEYTFVAPVRISRIEVVNGYDKVVGDLDLFEANARIRALRVETDGATTPGELTDTREPQSLEGPFGPSCRYRIVVDSVYPGSRFEDVALSEIAFFGTQDLQAACTG
jgi:ribosomal protein L37E